MSLPQLFWSSQKRVFSSFRIHVTSTHSTQIVKGSKVIVNPHCFLSFSFCSVNRQQKPRLLTCYHLGSTWVGLMMETWPISNLTIHKLTIGKLPSYRVCFRITAPLTVELHADQSTTDEFIYTSLTQLARQFVSNLSNWWNILIAPGRGN